MRNLYGEMSSQIDHQNLRHDVFQSAGRVDVSIGSKKQCFRILHGFDKFHAFFQTKQKTGGRKGVSVHGRAGKNRNLKQVILYGITCFCVQDMVINSVIQLKIPFISTGGND